MAGQPLREPSGESAEQPWRSSLDALEAALAEATRAITELRFSLEEENAANSGPVVVPDDPAASEKSERLSDFMRVWQRLERSRKEPSAVEADQDDLSNLSRFRDPSERLTDFERGWQRLERSRKEPSEAGADQDDLSELSSSGEPGERKEPSAVEADQDDLSKPNSFSEPSEPRGLKLLPSTYLMTIEDHDTSVDLITLQRGLLALAPMEDIRLLTYAKGVPVISLRSEGELDLERLSEAIGNATGRRCEVIPQDGTKLFLRLTANDDQEEETL